MLNQKNELKSGNEINKIVKSALIKRRFFLDLLIVFYSNKEIYFLQ